MSKTRKQTESAHPAGMHPGAVNLVGMIRRMAPFLFAKKKPIRKPHIQHAGKSPAKKRKAKKKAHTPAVKAAVAAPVLTRETRPKGALMVSEEEAKPGAAQVTGIKEELLEEEGFMQKVAKTPTAFLPVQKRSLWSMFERGPQAEQSPAIVSSETLKEDLSNDKFLQHVEQKNANSVVGTATDDPNAPPPPDLGIRPKTASALEAFAEGKEEKPEPRAISEEKKKGKIISAAQLKKEADNAKEASRRIAAETKKEMQQEQAQVADAKPKEDPKKTPPPPHVKHASAKQSNGLQKFIASLGHFGMGKERMQFIENLATMLDAGLPLIDALQTLGAETRHPGFRKIIARIVETVENGTPLWRAMDSEDLFSLHAIALVRIGEEAGNLAKNMQYLAAQETKDHELVQKVKMAMIYPSIVLTIMFIIVMGLGLFVLPNLIGVLTSLNVELPLVTRMVIAFSNAFSTHGMIIVPASIGSIVLFIILAKYTALKVPVQWVTFRIPGIGTLLRSATIARFGVIVGGLLAAGVPVVDSVQSLVEVTPILVYKHFYEKLRDHITIGDSFAKSFASIKGSHKLLPASVQQLVVTGEKSGALAEIMLKVADIYDKKASETAQKLPVILEPILLLIIGSLVGTIAFAIIVPIYSIVGNVGR